MEATEAANAAANADAEGVAGEGATTPVSKQVEQLIYLSDFPQTFDDVQALI